MKHYDFATEVLCQRAGLQLGIAMRTGLIVAAILAFSLVVHGADIESGLRAFEGGDYATALRELIPVAENGDARLQFIVGETFRLSQQPAKAMKWFQRAADQGFPQAEFSLGVMYENGTSVGQDYVAAATWYRKAADQGFAEAQFNLAMIYANGEGVKQDYGEASIWCRKAADKGLADAQFGLGRLYANGGPGLKRNYVEAAYWYRKAAEQNHPDSQASLCAMYVAKLGVPEDHSEAAKWCDRAARQGNTDAQLMLGGLYAMGQGVSKDLITAYMWISIAAPASPKAAELRDELAKEMTSTQIVQATELAHQWRPQPMTPIKDSAIAESISNQQAENPTAVIEKSVSPISHGNIPAPNLEKLRRYIDSEMLDEALEEAKRLIRTDEFDAELHLALGEVFFRKSELDEAVRQLTISHKIDASLWQATERLADTRVKLWQHGHVLTDRIEAAELYEQLAVFKDTEHRQVVAFSHLNDLTAAQRRAAELASELESPAGTWKTDYGKDYRITRGDSLWGFNPVNDDKNASPLHVSFSPPRGATISGQAEFYSYAGCLSTLSIEIRLLDHSTQMELDGTVEKMLGVSPEITLNLGRKTATKFCRDLASTALGSKIIQMKLIRIE